MNYLILILTAIITLGSGGLGYWLGWDSGRNKGRLEVLGDWWAANEAEADRGTAPIDATLDEIVRRNPTGGHP